MMIISSRAQLLGCSILAALQTSVASAARVPTLYVGRSVEGTWNDLSYQIFYYQTIKNVDGPSNQVDCVLDKLLNRIFVSLKDDDEFILQEMTTEEALRVDADYYAANPERAPGLLDGMGMSISGGNGFILGHGGEVDLEATIGNSSSLGDNTSDTTSTPTMVAPSLAQARSGMQDYKPTVYEIYHQGIENSLGERGGLEWSMEVKLGLYVDGVYLNRFDDIGKMAGDPDNAQELSRELQDLVLEQAKTMVLPERIAEAPDDDYVVNSPFFRQELLSFWPDLMMEISEECEWTLQGDLAGDNPSLANTTVIGRVVTGDLEGQTVDMSIFFEFYQLRGLETAEQEQCFVDSINSLFVTNESSIELSLDQQDFARSVIDEEHTLRNRYMYNETHPYSGSIYFGQAGAQVSLSLGGFTVSYQKGAIVTVDGEYIRNYNDYEADPMALRSFVNHVQDPVHEDLKHAFPINQTSQLKEFFLPMMMGPGGRPSVSFKPMKDGTGIFPMLFMENLIYCVNASLLEDFESPYGRPPQEEEEEEDPSGNNPDLMDVIVNPPALGDTEIEGEAEDPASLQAVSSGSVMSNAFYLSVVFSLLF